MKCRFCDWSTPAFRTRADGTVKSGWGLLNNHMEMCHEDELEALQARVAAEMAGKGVDDD